MKKLIIPIFVMIIIILGFFYYRHLDNKYQFKIEGQELIQVHYYMEHSARDFYKKYGEYPLNIVIYDDETDSIFSRTYSSSGFYNYDIFTKNEAQLAYYPLYNPTTGKRESFIILSAGVDGKLDNVFSETDTLYLDTWTEKVSLYNLGEYLIDKYNTYCYIKTNEYIPEIHGEIEESQLVWVTEIFQTEKYSSFSIKDRFFGKKDIVLMIDTVRHGLMIDRFTY